MIRGVLCVVFGFFLFSHTTVAQVSFDSSHNRTTIVFEGARDPHSMAALMFEALAHAFKDVDPTSNPTLQENTSHRIVLVDGEDKVVLEKRGEGSNVSYQVTLEITQRGFNSFLSMPWSKNGHSLQGVLFRALHSCSGDLCDDARSRGVFVIGEARVEIKDSEGAIILRELFEGSETLFRLDVYIEDVSGAEPEPAFSELGQRIDDFIAKLESKLPPESVVMLSTPKITVLLKYEKDREPVEALFRPLLEAEPSVRLAVQCVPGVHFRFLKDEALGKSLGGDVLSDPSGDVFGNWVSGLCKELESDPIRMRGIDERLRDGLFQLGYDETKIDIAAVRDELLTGSREFFALGGAESLAPRVRKVLLTALSRAVKSGRP
ncbi:MAG: hypothetical protein HY390_01395 [Deltaproteobacteria bacterium]|nr:hypothetical protein [Deltaproteobacteria bacterium]